MRTKNRVTANAAAEPSAATGRTIRALSTNALDTMMTRLLQHRGSGRGAGSGFGSARDYRSICGYIDNLTFEDYYETYDRGDLAVRIVETYPDYTWIKNPIIYERVGNAEWTDFERQWEALVKKVQPFAELRKLDVLAGIGSYGVMVIGINDGRALDKPVAPVMPGEPLREIYYHRAFHEGEARIVEFDQNPRSRRYGLPVMYEIQPGRTATTGGVAAATPYAAAPKSENPFKNSFRVHWTRCIHFADNALSGTVYGTPRLKRMFDRMTDLVKIVGGSGEMFWQGAYGGIAFEMDPDGSMSDEDEKGVRLEIDKFTQQLQRTILLQGIKANPLTPTITSPKDHLDVQLTMVSIASRIPKKILAGVEVGKLAGLSDAETWDTAVTTRRANSAQPGLLMPYLRFCVDNGIVSPPNWDNLTVEWPKMNSVPIEDKARAAEYFTTALDSYCSKALYNAVQFSDYLVYVWGYDSREAESLAKRFDAKAFEKIRKEAAKSNINTAMPAKEKKVREKSKTLDTGGGD